MPEDINEELGEVAVGGTVPRATIAVGMSFTVALTARLAALRLAHPGRDVLITRLGKANLRAVFAGALRWSPRRSTGWYSSQDGPCIVNAQALPAAALPAAVPPLASSVGLGAAGTLTAPEHLAPYLADRSTLAAAAALETLVGDSADHDLYTPEIAYRMSKAATIAEALAASASRAATADLRVGPTQQHFALERLREVTSPSVLQAWSSLLTCPSLCVQTARRYVGSAQVRRSGS